MAVCSRFSPLKMGHEFCASLLSNFNADLRRVKVDASKHLLITEADVEEILEPHNEGSNVRTTGETSQLDSLASICDLRWAALRAC